MNICQGRLILYKTDKSSKLEVKYTPCITITVWINTSEQKGETELIKNFLLIDYLQIVKDVRIISCSFDRRLSSACCEPFHAAAKLTYRAYEQSIVSDVPMKVINQKRDIVSVQAIEDTKHDLDLLNYIDKIPADASAPIQTDEKVDGVDTYVDADTHTSAHADIDTNTVNDINAINVIVTRLMSLQKHNEKFTHPPYVIDTRKKRQKLTNFIYHTCGVKIRSSDIEKLQSICDKLAITE
jgi:hypothetical protein